MKTSVLLNLSTLTFFLTAFSSAVSHAAPDALTFQGRLVDPLGHAVESPSTTLILTVKSPGAESCILFEETHNLNLTGSDGVFSVKVGTGTRTSNDEGFTLQKTFANSGSITGLTCAAGSTYTPGTGDSRKLFVTLNDGSGPVTFAQAYSIQSVPYAFEAETLAGKTTSDFLQVTSDTTQSKLNGLMVPATYTELLALLAGSSARYMTTSNSSPTKLPVLATAPTSPSAGQVWYEAGQIKFYDGSTSKTVGSTSDVFDGSRLDPAINISTTGSVSSSIQTTRDFKLFAPSPSSKNVSFSAATVTTDYVLNWPPAQGAADTILTNDGSGNLTWSAPAPSTQWTTATNDIYYMTGKVGVGTTTPGFTLDVSGEINARDAIRSNGVSVLRSQSGTTTLYAPNTNAIQLDTNSAPRVTVDGSGNVGIGITSPTALLNLKAGTTAANTAPLKLTSSGSGVLLTTPEDGAMEYDGTGLWFTIGSTRYLIPTNTVAGNFSGVSNVSNSGGSITLTPSAGNSVIVNQSTTSTSSSTGAFIVNGGVGVAGAINSASNISSGGTVSAVNSLVSPQIYGSNAASGTIKIDGTSNSAKGDVLLATAGGRVGVGTISPAFNLEVQRDGIGNTYASSALSIANATDATSTQQQSTFMHFGGKTWNSSNFSSAPVDAYLGLDSSTNNNPNFSLYLKRDGASAARVLGIDSFGQFVTSVNYAYYGAANTLQPGMRLSNSAPATSTQNQYSPFFHFYGSGWKTDATAASQAMSAGTVVAPETGTASPVGVLKTVYGTNSTTPSEANELVRYEWGNRLGVIFNKNNTANYTSVFNGSVGIGTTSPTSALTAIASADGNPVFRSVRTTTTAQYLQTHHNATANYLTSFTDATQAKPLYIDATTDSSNTSVSGGSVSLRLRTMGSDRVTIDQSGNVGVGTASPSTLLAISSTGANGIDLMVDKGAAANSGRLFFSTGTLNQSVTLMNTSGNLLFNTGARPNSGSGTERMRLTSAGSLGIGGAPAGKLDVSGGVNIGSNYAGGVAPPTDGAAIEGRVGIGRTAPSTKLDVAGGAVFRGPTVGGIDGELFYDTTTHSYQFYNAGTSTWQSLSSGNVTYNGSAWGQSGANLYYTAGSVGVGNSAPTETLDVSGTGRFTKLGVGAAAGSFALEIGGTARASNSYYAGSQFLKSGNSTAATPMLSQNSDSSTGIFLPGSGVIGFSGTGTERMRIDSSGNVGIGTTSPVDMVHIQVSSGLVDGGVSIQPYSGTSQAKVNFLTSAGAGNWSIGSYGTSNNFVISNGSALHTAAKFVIAPTTGNVGIGTTSPTAPMQVSTSSAATYAAGTIANQGIAISNIPSSATGNTFSQLRFHSKGGSNSTEGAINLVQPDGSSYDGILTFQLRENATGGDRREVLRLMPSGNVGIGTTSPGAALDIAAAGNSLKVGSGSASSASASFSGGRASVGFAAGSTPYAYISGLNNVAILAGSATPSLFADNGTGRIGIGTLSPSEKLDVVGNIVASGTITGASDRRLKTNIMPIENAVEKLQQIEGVSYDWRDPAKHSRGRQIGVIAQDVEKVFPEAVLTDQRGFKSVSYMALVAPLINAVKSIYSDLTGLKKEVSELQRKVATQAEALESQEREIESLKRSQLLMIQQLDSLSRSAVRSPASTTSK